MSGVLVVKRRQPFETSNREGTPLPSAQSTGSLTSEETWTSKTRLGQDSLTQRKPSSFSTLSKKWAAKNVNVKDAQDVFFHRAQANSLTSLDKYTSDPNADKAASQSLFVANQAY